MDLGFVRALYEDPLDLDTGYASVYLDTTPSTEGAATEVALRWLSARDRLVAAGADDATLNAMQQAVTDRTRPGDTCPTYSRSSGRTTTR
jgi:hypothetical protein